MQPEDETIHGDSMDSVLLTLHKTNQSLQEENCLLRNEVNTAEDKVQQLSHELSQKQMLMTLYHNEIESLERAATVNQDSQQRATLTTLEARAHQLEHEKWELTLELESRKADLEERGAKLDALKQSYLKQIENLRTKASQHEEAVRAQEEKNAALQLEKDLLVEKLKTWHHVVDQVKSDLEMKDRQIEDFVMRQHNFLDEAKAKQEEIDNLQKLYEARRDEARSLRMSAPRLYGRPRSYSAEECYDHRRSIRDELEDSLRRENQPPSPEYSPLSSPISKVFQTVRSANLLLDELENGHQLPVSDPTTQMDRSSTYSIGGDSGCGDLGSDDEISFGHPGIRSPEIKRRRRPMFPKKLQIIKPLEGSETLGHWQRLATPSLTKLLEVRDGVFSRDELESERGSRDWTDQGLGLAEPEEDDDPEVSRTCDREMADIREFRQPLTDGFIQGISCYGVKQHHRQSSVNTLETEEPRERSNSLVEKVRRSGLRASSLPVNSHVPVSQKSLQDHVVSGLASAFTNCPNSPVRRKSVPAQMGLNVCSHNRFGRPTSPTPSGLQLSPGGFGVADMMTKQILHFIRRMSYGDAPTGDNPTVKVKSSSQETTQASYYTGPKLRLRQGAPSSSRRRTSRLKIKIVKNKKPPTYSPLENKTDQGVSVLHTITSLRRNNLLIGGMPEVHTSSTSDATSFLDDITVGTIFSY